MLKIALIADLHYQGYLPGSGAERQGYFADIMLLRLVHRLNRFIRPDVVLVAGDLLDDNSAARRHLPVLRAILDGLTMPFIVIPGNHDPDPETFYRHMPRPPEQLDVKGVRLLAFADQQTAGFNARRDAAGIARLAAARNGFSGPIVTLQHVPLFPPGRHACPYNYDNAGAIIDAMQNNGIEYALSGHYHPGLQLDGPGPVRSLAAPALCAPPFRYMLLTVDAGQPEIETHALANPGLTDWHVHTPYAYCNENMDFGRAVRLGGLLGLEHLVFSEHSGQLYHASGDYWSGRFLAADGAPAARCDRITDYFADVSRYAGDGVSAGLEADCDFQGRPVILDEHRRLCRTMLGAIHFLPQSGPPATAVKTARDAYMAMADGLLRSGITVLAHPWRVFRRRQLPLPPDAFAALVKLLRANRVAAELNFHTNDPPPEFFRMCIEGGVKLCLGSDAHNLYEVGEFFPHLQFLRAACGYDGDLRDILLDASALTPAAECNMLHQNIASVSN